MAKKIITPPIYATNNVQLLPNKSVNQGTVIKATHDKTGDDIKIYEVARNAETAAETLDASGAHTVGFGSTQGDITSNNVGDALDEIVTIAKDAQAGTILPGSITDTMLSNLPGQAKENIVNNTNKTINNSKGIATNSAVIDELLVEAGISTKLAPTSGKFYDYPGASGQLSQGSIDFGKTFAATINTGTNTVIMTALQNAKDNSTPSLLSDCFVVGDEVTLQDDSIKETFKVTVVDDGLATLTLNANIVGTFATGANIYRSNIITDGNVFKFGGFTAETTIDKTTPIQVVASAFDTSGNGGRKIVRLDDGTLISGVIDSIGSFVRIYKSTDDGDTWVSLTNILSGASFSDISLVTDGVITYIIIARTDNNAVYMYSFDSDGVITAPVAPELSQTAMGNCSLAIAPNGDLHATWASKNATYPNSFNIRYSKSTDGGGNWDSPTQLSIDNTSGVDGKNPSITINSQGYPVIVMQRDNTLSPDYRIKAYRFNGTVWSNVNVYFVSTYAQSNPSADVKASGRIVVAWNGKDVTDSAVDNIRFSYSDDNGVTWSAMEKLTSGNTENQNEPSITRDKDDVVSIVWQGRPSAIYQVRLIQGNAGAWGSIENLTTRDENEVAYPSTCNNFRNFTKPLTIFRGDDSEANVQFYALYTAGTTTDITDIDIRMNIAPLNPVSDIGAYMNVTNNVLAVDSKVSIVDSAAAENYTDLIDTRYAIDATNDEVASLLNTTVTAEEKVTLFYNLTRTLITDDVGITSILGGVA